MVMTSVLGHVKELDFGPGYEDWQRVPAESLFQAPIVAEISSNMRDVAENLRAEARKCQALVIWTDCDREGEYIGSEIAAICTQARPGIDVFRARYSALTTAELRRALRSVARLDQRQVAAAELRSEVDLRAGAAFTRLQTVHLRSRFPDLTSKVISYGSCQFPTLGFVVEQYLRMVSFVPEPFWSIALEVTQGSLITKFGWRRGRLFDRQVASIFYERCVRRAQLQVTRVESRATSKWRPVPLRTVELQKLGARFLKLSSDKLMGIAEKLYNQGYISYPRTETDMFENGFDLRTLIAKQTGHPRWGSYAEGLLQEGEGGVSGFRWPRRGKNNDKAHPPIHPTKDGSDLEGVEAKVYEFVARRFLACCSDDAKGLETVVWARVGDEGFRARGVLVQELNYLKVYTYENWNDQAIGQFVEGQTLTPSRLELTDGTTTAPRLLSEPELIGSMDKNGIGTDATIHEHIKKILDRTYAVKTAESRFHPTSLGVALVLGYDRVGLEESLTKPKLRAELESGLRDICEGRREKEHVRAAAISYFAESFAKTVRNFEILLGSLEEHHRHGLFQPAPLADPSDDRRQGGTSDSRGHGRRPPDVESDGDQDFGPPKAPRCSGSGRQRRQDAAEEAKDATAAGPLCPCGTAAIRQITKKAGPNQGRAFWSCAQCKFFEWCTPGTAPPPSKVRTGDAVTRGSEAAGSVAMACNCGLEAVEKTVIKEGENKGRKFMVCPKAKENACSFFHWSDGGAAIGPAMRAGGNNSGGSSRRPPGQFDHGIECGCGMTAIRAETKRGDNAGRIYYRCPKTVCKCAFFHWDDEGPVPPRSAAGGAMPATGGATAGTCYRCGEEGHFANSCPQGSADGAPRRGRSFAGRRGRGGRARKTGSSRRTSTAPDYEQD